MRSGLPEMHPEIRPTYREIAPSVYWLPNCLGRHEPAGWMHIHAGCYLALGPAHTLLVDTGHPAHWHSLSETVDRLLAGRPLDFVFPTHTEIPHAGNLARLLKKHPESLAVGDTRDFHLFYPSVADRLRVRAAGEILSLGGEWKFHFTEAAIRDLPNTLWGYLAPAGVLFVSDGLMLSHHATGEGDEPLHAPDQCLLTTSEIREPFDLSQITFVTERSIYWMRYADPIDSIRRLRRAISAPGIELIAPTHSNVVDNPETLVGLFEEAWERIASRETTGRSGT